MKQLTDLSKMVEGIKVTPEMRKSLLWVCVGLFGALLLFFGMPWVIEHTWNNFFAVVFHLPRFYYLNALALMFWVMLVVGLIALLKE